MTDRPHSLLRDDELRSTKSQRLSEEIQRLRVRAIRYGYEETAEALERARQTVDGAPRVERSNISPIPAQTRDDTPDSEAI
ncbi:MAG: hypothetical protein AAGJ92_01375 [Pseudomonadota bacterium]